MDMPKCSIVKKNPKKLSILVYYYNLDIIFPNWFYYAPRGGLKIYWAHVRPNP